MLVRLKSSQSSFFHVSQPVTRNHHQHSQVNKQRITTHHLLTPTLAMRCSLTDLETKMLGEKASKCYNLWKPQCFQYQESRALVISLMTFISWIVILAKDVSRLKLNLPVIRKLSRTLLHRTPPDYKRPVIKQHISY